jgi:hypothetical protein
VIRSCVDDYKGIATQSLRSRRRLRHQGFVLASTQILLSPRFCIARNCRYCLYDALPFLWSEVWILATYIHTSASYQGHTVTVVPILAHSSAHTPSRVLRLRPAYPGGPPLPSQSSFLWELMSMAIIPFMSGYL